MSRTVKEYDVRRGEILTTAQDLFFSKGYEATTVQEIIDAVGIAKGTFYHYFDSKVDLLDALILSMTELQLQNAKSILDEGELNAAQKMELIFSDTVGWKTENSEFFLDILRTWYSDDNLVVRIKLSFQAKLTMRAVLAQIVRQGVDEGIFDTPYPERIGDVILDLLANTSEQLAYSLIGLQPQDYPLANLEEISAVNRHVINLLLGAKPGTVQIYNPDQLKLWFESQ
ncbi:MAG: TetR/AcrR family transcriptional regulator [Anaerolineales bacterium]|jgi:AcrR family transcriptional regulator|nr:TetR/AcrR family transcriptional regulator [Anaerolineales bacterium]